MSDNKHVKKNVKVCVICGKEYFSPKSIQKVTCSDECKLEYRRRCAVEGNFASRLLTPEAMAKSKARAYTPARIEVRNKATEAKRNNPLFMAGEKNISAKIWIAYDPDGVEHEFTNLNEFARRNWKSFFPNGDVEEGVAVKRVACGFRNIVASINGAPSRVKRNCYVWSYKGWTLKKPPEKK